MKRNRKFLLVVFFTFMSFSLFAQPDPPRGPYGSPVPIETGMVLLGAGLLYFGIRKLRE